MSIIKVEDLSKKYIIGHDKAAAGAYRYYSLRESLVHHARGVYQRLRHPLTPNQENTELEEFWALKDINFEIKQGDRVGIIGRNGAGKSTLLKILSRITEPTSGKITMKGRVASLLEVGTGFHPELTGRENIYLNGAILGMTRIEIKKKFDEIVDFAEIEKFLDTPVKRYSSGMYVRLAFAVAAHLEPEILLVDEVLAVGDAQFQKKCLGKMEDVSKEGRTVVFVSHNMGAISQLCSDGILLDQGEMVHQGAVSHILKKYKLMSSGRASFLNKKEGKNKISFNNILLSNEDNNPCSIFEMGNSINISFGLAENIIFKNIEIGIQIINKRNIPVINLTATDSNIQYTATHKTKKLVVSFDNVLYPGTYSINFWIGSLDITETFDYVENALFFDVINTKKITERNLTESEAVFFTKSKWSIETND